MNLEMFDGKECVTLLAVIKEIEKNYPEHAKLISELGECRQQELDRFWFSDKKHRTERDEAFNFFGQSLHRIVDMSKKNKGPYLAVTVSYFVAAQTAIRKHQEKMDCYAEWDSMPEEDRKAIQSIRVGVPKGSNKVFLVDEGMPIWVTSI